MFNVDVPPSWADQAPGRELFEVVAGSAPDALGDYDLVELIRATGRLAAHVDALQARAVAALARRPRYAQCVGDPERRHEHDAAKAAADEVSAVTIPATALLGISDHPGVLRGFGPITPDTARTLAADGSWRRLLTDPVSGALLDYGRTTYAPPQALRDIVITRDKTCRFGPGDIDADRADIDHSTAASDGGDTSDANNGPLHRRHHTGKTLHAWRLRQERPGHYQWISPAGHVYEIEPEEIGVIVEVDDNRHPMPVTADPDPPPF